MKIKITFGEILDAGAWDAFCDLRGVNPWCMNEGLATRKTETELTPEEALMIGLPLTTKEPQKPKNVFWESFIESFPDSRHEGTER